MLSPSMNGETFSIKWLKALFTSPECLMNNCLARDKSRNVLSIGGQHEDGGVPSAVTHRYSVSDNKWSKGPDLNKKRCMACATYLDGFVYTFYGSGSDLRNSLDSIERIDTEIFQEWQMMQT